jgi:transglutaminase-like putative cysteine protease
MSANPKISRLQASGADYLLLAAASAVPLYLSGLTMGKPLIGMIFVSMSWFGIFFSFIIRRFFYQTWMKNSGWIQVIVAIAIVTNFRLLNSTLPDGGFPWQLAPAAVLGFLVALGSFFLWSDGAVLFQLVPGVALFGIQSWFETEVYFELSLVVFMISGALLLIRLHQRQMYMYACAAGYNDLNKLLNDQWKAMAKPILSIISVVIVAALSFYIAPLLGSAVETIAPQLRLTFQPNPSGQVPISQESVERRIGLGPATASNLPLIKIKTNAAIPYLRTYGYGHYRGSGWREINRTAPIEPSPIQPESKIPDAKVFLLPRFGNTFTGKAVTVTVESINRPHLYAHSPGHPIRIEYPGTVTTNRGEFVIMEDAFPSGKRYQLTAITPNVTPQQLRFAPPSDRQRRKGVYAQDRYDDRVVALAEKIDDRNSTDYDTVLAYIQEIQDRCKYNLKADAIGGEKDRVATFLFESHEGYCDLFASALAVMCRSVGIPARVVIGYRVDPNSTDGEWIIIRDRHAHMWTEVFFEGIGWVPFDATNGARSTPRGGVGDTLDEDDWGSTNFAWTAQAGAIVFGLIVFAFLVGALLSFIKTQQKINPMFARIRPLYRQFMRIVQKTVGRQKKNEETLREYINTYISMSHNGRVAINVLRSFEKAFYGNITPSQEIVEQLKKDLDSFTKEVKRPNEN